MCLPLCRSLCQLIVEDVAIPTDPPGRIGGELIAHGGALLTAQGAAILALLSAVFSLIFSGGFRHRAHL